MARLGNLERDVMEQVWAAGAPVTVREVHEALAKDRDLAYTTVMTVLDRLAKKNVVRRVRDGRAYRYEAVATKDQMVADLMREVLDGAGDGADRTAALVRFVGQATPEEAAALREALSMFEDDETSSRSRRG
ncbi:BlaI/MecI/CopY family transcriptional regulator [Thermasporomyces composti]|uniref:CopY family transcriptional repressor n=1 Tax=Thermasporomyces composti TaxID=696763 RepID=A0A3D9V1E0_THECX|nr:BlaI/MecI/CopY family transcriptional regulator [Thermasporomyces composti]REF35216.1 CopY family transcriptional repressor [Thermasporomyces composti]